MENATFTQKFSEPITSAKVEQKGQKIYKAGKIGMMSGLVGLILIVLFVLGTTVIFGGEYIGDTLALKFDSSVAFLMPIMICAYLGVVFGVVGIFLYFYGMQLFVLGRIAHNTEKN